MAFWKRKQQEIISLGLNRAATPEEERIVREEAEGSDDQARFYDRFKKAVSSTRENLAGRIDSIFAGKRELDADVLDHLEEALIGADIGVQTSLEIIDSARQQIERKQLNDVDELKKLIKSELRGILEGAARSRKAGTVASESEVPLEIRPYVMMIVGVNGVGKTTTIGKLAHRIKSEGNQVMVCAADTFRAAANDQLAIWAERSGVPLIQQKPGTDPSAVLFDALAAARARNIDVLIVDTAGRLHTKANLMQELEKMRRVAGREVAGAPHEVLLIIDAVTGQNGLEQARQFTRAVPITGLVLTKLDGTAKGGIVIAIAKELNVPIRYVGIGEQMNDLVEFSPEAYIDGLFG
ncbi:MAG: signal recognition particle-docking protein FtsY [Blastocatellia bacterium AA13]|nr:MAG: signal recognition particle-docking protein FtsY [Blastocatellia bacterium AA13]